NRNERKDVIVAGAGDESPGERRNEPVVVTADGGKPLEPDAEHVHQQYPQAERRNGGGQEGKGIKEAVEDAAPVSGQRSEDVADQPSNDDRRKLQRQRPRESGGDDFADPLRTLQNRGAEIHLQADEEVIAELRWKRCTW